MADVLITQNSWHQVTKYSEKKTYICGILAKQNLFGHLKYSWICSELKEQDLYTFPFATISSLQAQWQVCYYTVKNRNGTSNCIYQCCANYFYICIIHIYTLFAIFIVIKVILVNLTLVITFQGHSWLPAADLQHWLPRGYWTRFINLMGTVL